MNDNSRDLRYQLDGPMRKVREDLGLPPLDAKRDSQHVTGPPRAILEHTGDLTKEQEENIRRDFERIHATPDNAHKPLVIDKDMRLSGGPDVTVEAPEFDTVAGI